jgi:opacity protein-like surface antigen
MKRCVAVAALSLGLLAAPAAADSARDVFEQRGLIGTFAVDCKRPVGPMNPYTWFRALGGGRVQIDLMVGPGQRQYAYVIDRAEARGRNEVAISMVNPQLRLDLVYRVENGRLRTVQSVQRGGSIVVGGGVFTANGRPTPWLTRCSAQTV